MSQDVVRVRSGSPFEASIGYCRALRTGNLVAVSGTAPVMPGGAPPPSDAFQQTLRSLEIAGEALSQLGASFDDVVRTRIYLTDINDFEAAGRAHAQVLGAVQPTNTILAVSAFADPRWKVELEIDAVIRDAAGEEA